MSDRPKVKEICGFTKPPVDPEVDLSKCETVERPAGSSVKRKLPKLRRFLRNLLEADVSKDKRFNRDREHS